MCRLVSLCLFAGIFSADTYRPARSLPSPARSYDDQPSLGREDVERNVELGPGGRNGNRGAGAGHGEDGRRGREHGRRRRDERRPQALLHGSGHRPVRRDRVGAPRRAHPRQGRTDVRAEGRRVPQVLVADGDEHRGAEVLPRPHGVARARALRQADDRPRRRHDRRLGPRGRLLRVGRGGGHLRGRAQDDPRQPVRVVQLAGLVQRRLRGAAAVLGLLHPLDRRLDGVDPRLDPP